MHRILKAVVDTGPLLSVLVLKYASTLHPGAASAVVAKSRISPYLRTPADQAGMVSLFEGIRTLLTSSHVVGELQGLQHLQDQRRREFWLYAMTWLASKGMQEELVRLLDLNSNTNRQKAVCEIGPTDTGLVELASERELCCSPTTKGCLRTWTGLRASIAGLLRTSSSGSSLAPYKWVRPLHWSFSAAEVQRHGSVARED